MTDDPIDVMHGRIDALFPENDTGYGRDFRRTLWLLDTRGLVPTEYRSAALRLLSELLDRMESDAREEEERDLYWSKVYDEERAEGLPL